VYLADPDDAVMDECRKVFAQVGFGNLCAISPAQRVWDPES